MPPRSALLALLLGGAVCLAPSAAHASGTVELIVRREAGLTAAERADVRADAGVGHRRTLGFLSHTEIVTVPAGDAARALRELNADPDVRWAQRDSGARKTATGNADSFWSKMWALQNTGQVVMPGDPAGVADADMDGVEAWQRSTGSGVTVAIVDSGVDGAHEDLAGQVLTNPGETGAGRESNGVDDDGNGYVDDWRGWDFAYGDNDPSDLDGHGTNVAGIVAARNGNGKGGSGLAPDARVLNLKALNDTGSGDWSEIAEAFDYAGRAGVRVVNASLGGDGYVPVIDNTVAQWPDTLYVVSAGNDSLDLDTTTYYPCEAAPENVLCVGASDNRDEKPGFSNFSPTAVDVFAPGVLALGPAQGSYFYYSGTSQAAPHVSALAALLLARDGSLTAAQVKQAIIDSAEPRAQLAAYGRGGGRANAQVALDLLSAPGGSDTDGDGVLDGADSCPDTAGVPWLAGCPLPATPPPDPPSTGQAPGNSGGGGGQGGGGGVPPEPAPARLTRIDVSARGGKVNVRVRTSRPVSVRVAAQRKVCRAGRCTWKTVRTARVSRTGKAKLRLAAGRYRLQVSALGAATRYRAVTVRG